MHFVQFGGITPKYNPKLIQEKNAVVAENLDVYGTRFLPHKELGRSVGLLTIDGQRYTDKTLTTVVRVGETLVGWPEYTSTAEDPVRRLGRASILFVSNGVLWRQSERRILLGKKPIRVGIARPDCKSVPTATVLSGAGCKVGQVPQLCIPTSDDECNPDAYPGEVTAYKYTYINRCHEESSDSMPSNFVDVQDGDAVELRANDAPPENAVARRWYRSVADSEGNAHWLFVGESPISSDTFHDTICPLDMGVKLETEVDYPPPECIEGIASIGNNRVILWGGRKVYMSPVLKPHAYPTMNVWELRHDILRIDSVTERVEGSVSYQCLALTNGYHYRLINDDSRLGISEIEARLPAIKASMATVNESIVYFIANEGLCELSVQGVKLMTGEIVTEREWSEFWDRGSKLTFHDDKLFIWGKKNVVFTLGVDDRREASMATLTLGGYAGFSDYKNQLCVFLPNDQNNFRLFGGGHERLQGVWRSKPIMMSGLWRPVTLKVISPEFSFKSYKFRQVEKEYKIWAKKTNGSIESFIKAHPSYEGYRAEFYRIYPQVEVILFADGKEYYRRYVSSNRPILIPRKYKALDWQVEIRSKLIVEEVHIQTSRESLLSED